MTCPEFLEAASKRLKDELKIASYLNPSTCDTIQKTFIEEYIRPYTHTLIHKESGLAQMMSGMKDAGISKHIYKEEFKTL
jgi:hypothetical protein